MKFSPALLALLLVLNSTVHGVEAPTAPAVKATPAPYSSAMWEKEIAAFEAADQKAPPPKHGILFIGSSSIRRWTTLQEDFPGLNVLNRGFGGSRVSDAVVFIPRIVLPYQPRQICFYSGGNDLNAGEKPEAVTANFRAFAFKVHAALPHTEIDYISISPNFKRWAQVEQVRGTNGMIEQFCGEHPEFLKFINFFPLMLGADGQPLPDIYVEDGLHMNPKGYAIWVKNLRAYLTPETAQR